MVLSVILTNVIILDMVGMEELQTVKCHPVFLVWVIPLPQEELSSPVEVLELVAAVVMATLEA